MNIPEKRPTWEDEMQSVYNSPSMAFFHSSKLLRLSSCHSICEIPSSISSLLLYSSFSESSCRKEQETHVLNQLSELLPLAPYEQSSRLPVADPRIKPPDSFPDAFLPPEDKLRGVFLQKLKGKSAIHLALSNVNVDLTLELFSKVVNYGNLSGEWIVTFFDWAMKRLKFENLDIDTRIAYFNAVLKALGRRKYLSFMMDILHHMKLESGEEPGTGVHPDSETLYIVVDSLIKAHRVGRAIKLFKNLDDYGWDNNNGENYLNVLLNCLCRRNHVGAASSLFNAMRGKVKLNAESYNIIICGWSRLGEVSEAENILKAMVEDGFNPDCVTLSYLIVGLGKADRFEDAVEIFESMKENASGPNTGAYNAIISIFLATGDYNRGMKYYERMLDENCEPDVDTYTRLIAACLKARRVADALEFFDEMINRGIVPSTGTVTSFIKPLCSFGPPHAAMMIYKKAKKAGCTVSLTAYKVLLMRLSRFGKCGTILCMWDEIQENGYSCDVEVYEHVINGLCNIGQLENAVLVMEECLRKGFCPSRLICSKLNNKLLAYNKVERAYKLFQNIKKARIAENARKFWRANGWHF